MGKKLLILVVVILLVAGGYLLYHRQYAKSHKILPVLTPSPTESTTPAAVTSQAVISAHVVTYTDSGFSPKSLTIKKGETVTWINQSSESLWVASNPHPTHSGYPTKGGCISSTFDSCKPITKGESWSFTFDIVGTWGYHNHLNPSSRGTIIVQ